VHGIPVAGAPELLLDDQTNLELEEVVIAMPNAPAKRVAEIVRTLERLRLKFSTVPSVYELTTGQAKVSHLRSVDVQELLGREQVRLATGDIRQLLQDRVVMVTGAGGSIGSELCRQIASYAPRALLLVEQSEVQLFQIEQELIESGLVHSSFRWLRMFRTNPGWNRFSSGISRRRCSTPPPTNMCR